MTTTYRDPGFYAVQQNYLRQPNMEVIRTGAQASDPDAGSGYELENVMNYLPGRVARFDTSAGATEKRINFSAQAEGHKVNCIALINVHTRMYDSTQIGDIPVEHGFRVKLTAGTTPTQIWPASGYAVLDADHLTRYGANIFGTFSLSSTYTQYNVHLGMWNGSTFYGLEVGCILLGRSYIFPTNPVIPFQQQATMSTLIAGRQGGMVQPFVRDEAERAMRMQFFSTDEDTRAEMSRLIAGRGERTSYQADIKKRLDMPTAVIGPDMWDSGLEWGACLFGYFGPIRDTYGVDGSAFSELDFTEIVSPAG